MKRLTVNCSEEYDGVAECQRAGRVAQGEAVAGGGRGEHNLVLCQVPARYVLQ